MPCDGLIPTQGFLPNVYKQGSETQKNAMPWTPLVVHAMQKE
jgi:hypothetical protein